MFSRRVDKIEKNLDSKELEDLFLRIKSVIYEKFETDRVAQFLFVIAKLLKEKEALYKNYVNEGETEKIIEEVDSEIENFTLNDSIEPYVKMRKFLAEENMEFLKPKLNDQNIINKFKKKDGSTFCLFMLLLDYQTDLYKILDKNGLFKMESNDIYTFIYSCVINLSL
ncbi:unnamed protein product [Meloidogyne enterolobii]|uniref:Uncharacterized protein n=1 Tax=Meloidogyne enterolobii TaxID=390850 RepID=A0ACB1ANQ1_MELEN